MIHGKIKSVNVFDTSLLTSVCKGLCQSAISVPKVVRNTTSDKAYVCLEAMDESVKHFDWDHAIKISTGDGCGKSRL